VSLLDDVANGGMLHVSTDWMDAGMAMSDEWVMFPPGTPRKKIARSGVLSANCLQRV